MEIVSFIEMKGIPSEHYETLFQINESDALAHIECALQFLKNDNDKKGLDKVVGDYTYEELIATLLESELAIKSHVAHIKDLEREIEELQ